MLSQAEQDNSGRPWEDDHESPRDHSDGGHGEITGAAGCQPAEMMAVSSHDVETFIPPNWGSQLYAQVAAQDSDDSGDDSSIISDPPRSHYMDRSLNGRRRLQRGGHPRSWVEENVRGGLDPGSGMDDGPPTTSRGRNNRHPDIDMPEFTEEYDRQRDGPPPVSFGSGHRIPRSWDDAHPSDKLIVAMRDHGCKWREIDYMYTQMTGLVPARVSLSNRFQRIKFLMIQYKTAVKSIPAVDEPYDRGEVTEMTPSAAKMSEAAPLHGPFQHLTPAKESSPNHSEAPTPVTTLSQDASSLMASQSGPPELASKTTQVTPQEVPNDRHGNFDELQEKLEQIVKFNASVTGPVAPSSIPDVRSLPHISPDVPGSQAGSLWCNICLIAVPIVDQISHLETSRHKWLSNPPTANAIASEKDELVICQLCQVHLLKLKWRQHEETHSHQMKLAGRIAG